MIGLGVGLCLVLALVVSRLLASIRFGVEPTDALTLALAARSFAGPISYRPFRV